MSSRVSRFFRSHPILRDALLWAIPALIVGMLLRWFMLSYLPLAYWGSDSKSYYGFAHRLLTEGGIDYVDKRRYLYPLLMVPPSLLPGEPVRWVGWLQHLLGVLSVLPLAYVVRKTMFGWRLWVIPVTVLYVLNPLFLWFEQELLGETVFFAGMAWAFGGWVAWVMEPNLARSRRLFWWFYIPIAVFLLTKPSGRFLVGGLMLGLVMVKAWRRLDWLRWAALVVLGVVTLTVGSNRQGAWLLYTASFPLTQLDTPLHADYKADIRPMVLEQAADLDTHYLHSRAAKGFLDSPSKFGGTPLWVALEDDDEKMRKLYMDLALEAIKARPMDYLYLTFQRLVASSNLSSFGDIHFGADFYPSEMKKLYDDAEEQIEKANAEIGAKPSKRSQRRPSLMTAFNLPKDQPLPPYEEFRKRLSVSGTFGEKVVVETARLYERNCSFVSLPRAAKGAPESELAFGRTRITPLGWWAMASLALSLFWWRTLAVWTLAALGLLVGTYMCALVQPRFFAPAWLVFLPVFVLPLEMVARCFRRKKSPSPAVSEASAGG